MKRIMLGMAFLGVMFTASLWAHHAAEGIVSDDLWDMIDENLEGSPHLDIDLSDMGLEVEDVDGDTMLATTVEVDLLSVEAQSDPSLLINDIFDPEFETALGGITSQIPSGTSGAAVFYEAVYIDDDQDGQFESAIITIFEPSGVGNSQDSDNSTPPPEDPPGPQNGG